MRRDSDGVWSVKGKALLARRRYRFEVEVYAPSTQKIETNLVTDPYSLGLTTDSARSVLVDLRSREVTPSGWKSLRKPPSAATRRRRSTSCTVRDFSNQRRDRAGRPRDLPRLHRRRSDGMTHLRQLAEAGMGYVHCCRSTTSRRSRRTGRAQETPDLRPGLVRPGERGAAGVRHGRRRKDAFNWGYDPLALHRARGLVLHRPRRHGPQP